jgi:magnesium chelatase family protein
MRQGRDLVSVQVELMLAPGLPQIRFLGLPDTAMKESALRIRTAVRKQGFRFPRAQQILVHLRPNHLRKSSQGLDLAVAAALLWETKQIPPPTKGKAPILYGELSLSGAVITPDDIGDIRLSEFPADDAVYTGESTRELALTSLRLRELKDLKGTVSVHLQASDNRDWIRPLVRVKTFPQSAATLAEVICVGEHSALIAGPPGTGKTVLAESIPSWLEEPRTEEALREARRFTQEKPRWRWRPIVRPHHSITPAAMIGGGRAVLSGEITRAHTGVLILDELLEFHKDIQEALREPIETGSVSIARAGQHRQFDAKVLLLATTNLCACGKFVPMGSDENCRCSRAVRNRILGRLTGPFADRFAILAFSDEWQQDNRSRTAHEISSRVRAAIDFRVSLRAQRVPNSALTLDVLKASVSEFQSCEILSSLVGQSHRRLESVLRVARSVADLRLSVAISHQDLNQALKLSFRGHQLLEQCRG